LAVVTLSIVLTLIILYFALLPTNVAQAIILIPMDMEVATQRSMDAEPPDIRANIAGKNRNKKIRFKSDLLF
jgi:hypothetical protein